MSGHTHENVREEQNWCLFAYQNCREIIRRRHYEV